MTSTIALVASVSFLGFMWKSLAFLFMLRVKMEACGMCVTLLLHCYAEHVSPSSYMRKQQRKETPKT